MDNLIKALADKLGDNAIIKDSDVQYTVQMQDFLLMVHKLESSSQLLLCTSIAPVPEHNRQKLYLRLLQGQYFFQETAGATLSVDNEEKFIALQYVQHLSALSPDVFINVVERFMQAAQYWQEICMSFANEQTNTAHTDLSSDLDMLKFAMKV